MPARGSPLILLVYPLSRARGPRRPRRGPRRPRAGPCRLSRSPSTGVRARATRALSRLSVAVSLSARHAHKRVNCENGSRRISRNLPNSDKISDTATCTGYSSTTHRHTAMSYASTALTATGAVRAISRFPAPISSLPPPPPPPPPGCPPPLLWPSPPLETPLPSRGCARGDGECFAAREARPTSDRE